jgi:hypothetical protein
MSRHSGPCELLTNATTGDGPRAQEAASAYCALGTAEEFMAETQKLIGISLEGSVG